MKEQLNIETTLSDQESFKETLGLDGKLKWPVRIMTPLLFVAVLLVNYFLGINSNKEVSDKFHLYVTPPGYFFTIWAVIYSGLLIANIYNIVRNQWNLKAHIYFAISNILNIAWTLVFDQGTLASVVVASVILASIGVFILLTWIQIGNIPSDARGFWVYLNRNIFAFYLGWVIAAANINFGMDIVYWWDASKHTQMIIFWVMAPMCAIGAFVFNCLREGKYGALSCFSLWLSVGWAFAGAAITSHGCLNGTLELC